MWVSPRPPIRWHWSGVAQKRDDPQTPYLIGEMTNALVTAQMALEGMSAIAANYDFALVDETANGIFIRKTIAARAAIQTIEKAWNSWAAPPCTAASDGAPLPRCPGWTLPSLS